jgi:hypothetical protein
MYKNLSAEELELLIEHSKRKLVLLTKFREKGGYGAKNYEAQVSLLLDDMEELKKESEKRKY